MKHQHLTNIKEYADQAERAISDIKGAIRLYRRHPNEVTFYDLQQLVGELHTKSCAMIHESSMVSDQEIKAGKR